jgi:hypothetical protein
MAIFGSMLQEHFVNLYRRNSAVRSAKLRDITTRSQAEEYVKQLQTKVRKTFQFPAGKCPLNPRITGKVVHPGYVIEKIIIDSRPGFPVTMNLYLPEKFDGKLAANLILAGHSPEGKFAPYNCKVAQGIALLGGAALAIDPAQQGERSQYEKDTAPVLTCAHNHFNRKLKATGDNFANWRVYDAIRAVDYLLTRPEIDSERIAVSGLSGGGTLTALLNAVDSRLCAAAPACYITRWVRNVENELPVDGEQILPCFAADGGDMADLLLAAAPRPVLIIGQQDDFFDIRGTREVYQEVRDFYELLGHGDRVRLFVGPFDHSLCPGGRNAIYDFYAKYLGLKAGAEPELPEVAREETFCLEDGSVYNKPFNRTIHELIAEQARETAANRPALSDEELKQELRKLLGIGEITVPSYRQLRPRSNGIKMFNRYGVETGDDILVVLKSVEKDQHFHLQKSGSVEIYIPHQDSETELADREIDSSRMLYGLDYRGIGETMPNGCDQWEHLDFFSEYHFDYHYDSLDWLMGRSMLGGRVRDILSTIELIHQNGTADITLSASGIGMIPAIFAAFLCEHPVKLVLQDKVTTYLENSCTVNDTLPQSMIPEGILKLTDLDDLINRLQ